MSLELIGAGSNMARSLTLFRIAALAHHLTYSGNDIVTWATAYTELRQA